MYKGMGLWEALGSFVIKYLIVLGAVGPWHWSTRGFFIAMLFSRIVLLLENKTLGGE